MAKRSPPPWAPMSSSITPAMAYRPWPSRRLFRYPVSADRRQQGAVEVVAGGVEDGEVGDVVQDAVVERVRRHVVGRLEQAGHDESLAGERQRRQDLVQQFGGDAARAQSHHLVEGVAVRSSSPRSDAPSRAPAAGRVPGTSRPPGPCPREPGPRGPRGGRAPSTTGSHTTGSRPGEGTGSTVRKHRPADGAVDPLRATDGDAGHRRRHQQPLLVVHQVEHGGPPQGPCGLQHDVRQLPGCGQVGAVEERPYQSQRLLRLARRHDPAG